ncbi:MAG: GDP-L-fucose synthase [Euryarchaeota archaeon]|nr:GDP-L-fucose synthase [Euryarchaeota archaeon]
MNRGSKIFVAGHRGLVGSAITRRLQSAGHTNLVTRTRNELDLTDQARVRGFFDEERPEFVFVAAAKVGGIHANNTLPAEFIWNNLMIQSNVIDAAYRSGVTKLLFLGSSCIYPRLAPQPMKEEHLLTGSLEPTNEWYAVAKIAGIKTCQAYRRQYGFDAISAMPANLYGPGDNFHPLYSHVLPALMRRFHEAKKAGAKDVVIWGTGAPRREFLHCDDLADAALFLMETYEDERTINVGAGTDMTIGEAARTMAEVVGYHGQVMFDPSKPDGQPKKLLDTTRLSNLGWRPKIPFRKGLEDTYRWFLENESSILAEPALAP